MISVARGHLCNAIWYRLWPIILLKSTVFGFNLLVDRLRDVFDPHAHRSNADYDNTANALNRPKRENYSTR